MDKEKNKNLYWKLNLTIVGSLLAIWFMVSFGAGILFSENLDQFEIAGFKLGFWFAQQGSIIIFVFLIALYCFLMNKLDKRFNVEEE
ncbi:MAG: hypothetical protein CML96_06845 [Rhodobiaceae bacterium]|mgnify:FL=1|jgi:putative solute:sodium symporter small subunit|nr:hypothetical protein [Rhodobiaceae bacterium]|tara:strand:- start:308 stop:568 length:261 start_codon:yes stop_codon:yes gene_type:complete